MPKADKPKGAPAKPAGPKPAGGGKSGGARARRQGRRAAREGGAGPGGQAAQHGEIPPRLRERYRSAIVPALMQERGYRNPHQVPRLVKIVLNMGIGEAMENAKALDAAVATWRRSPARSR